MLARYQSGECPCCGHNANTVANTVSEADDEESSDTDESTFNPVFDDDDQFDPTHNYFDDNDDNQPFGGAITV